MHKQIEDYLANVERSLGPLPQERRDEELKEMRQHLYSTVELNQLTGQTEDQAVAAALQQFGGHRDLGARVVSAWRREEWRRRVIEAPELVAFAAFSLFITLSSLWLTFAGPMQWRDAAAPYTGGSLATPYMFSLFFTWAAIFASEKAPKSHLAPIVFLLMYATFGAMQYLYLMGLPNYHNPYLSANPWQPVWTVALPVAWALVIGGSQAIRKYKTRQKPA